MMAVGKPTTLIIGNGDFARLVAKQARSQTNDQVFVALPENTGDSTLHLGLDDYKTYVDIFQHVIDQSHDHHIDRLVLIFPPRQPNRTSEISGTDLSVVDGITYPLLYATKVALHHFRRDFRDLKVPRRITVLADKRNDVESRTACNAVLGFWRSLNPRYQVLGIVPEIIVANIDDPANTDLTISTLLTATSKKPTVHVIDGGVDKTQPAHVGQCYSQRVMAIGLRYGLFMWLYERFTVFKLHYQPWISPNYSKSTAIQRLSANCLRILPTTIFAVLAATAYSHDRPVSAFFCSLVAARTSTFGGLALLGLGLSQYILRVHL